MTKSLVGKNLVFANAEVAKPDGQRVRTWELVAFGPCPVMHAIWAPQEQVLVVQLDSVTENTVPHYETAKNGKMVESTRRRQQYYVIKIADPAAIQAILDNFVVNYDGQEWKIDPPEPKGPEEVENEFQQETL